DRHKMTLCYFLPINLPVILPITLPVILPITLPVISPDLGVTGRLMGKITSGIIVLLTYTP
ncbi:hypothetical protein QDQ59_20685, partial [Providencia rettgeri]|uniref:hypothetical protein n=1 Tax=Providencia rettgeri TaxID=587 RepID=UPI00244C7447